MKKLILFIAMLLMPFVCFGQTKAMTKVARSFSSKGAKKAAMKAMSKEAPEVLLREGVARTGSRYSGEALGKQIVKKVMRDDVMKRMEKEGMESFLEYGTSKAMKDLGHMGVSDVKKNLLKREAATATRLSAYHLAIENAERESKNAARNTAENTAERTAKQGAKAASKKVVRSLTGKEAYEYLLKHHPEVAKNIAEIEKRLGNNFHLRRDMYKVNVLGDGSVEVQAIGKDVTNCSITIKGNKIYANSGGFTNSERHGPTQAKIVKNLDGTAGVDDGGHLFSNTSNGSNTLINEVPMNQNINRNGEWRKFEELEEKYIKGGKNVKSYRKILYKGSSKRPYAIKVKLVVDGKTIAEKTITI